MTKLNIEDVFGTTDERVIETLEPHPRPAALPWWPVALVAASVVLAVVRARQSDALWVLVDRGGVVLAAIGVAIFAGRLEERLFFAHRKVPVLLRIPIVAALVAVALVAGTALAAQLRALPWLGQRLALFLQIGGIWIASAALGGLIILIIDGLARAFVPGFRSRIVLSVLSLITAVFAVCGFLAFRAAAWLSTLPPGESGPVVSRFLGTTFADLQGIEALWSQPGALFLGVFIGGAAVALPAVLSVCSKHAETVMERITPLMRAIERVAEGDRSVHLEEAGGLEFCSLALCFNEMVDKLYVGGRIERAFGQYVSTQVLDRVRAQRGAIRLPAEVRQATTFFADIRGFTPLSEKLSPEAVVSLLNRYLEQVVPVVEAHQGFLNKFIGDAVVVVFNGPIDQPDHAQRATCCAIDLQKRMAQLNAEGAFAEVGKLEIGIGVATGSMLCGNIGTKSRLEYTVIGDTVNLASRMTGHARGGEVWISETTAYQLPKEMTATPSEPIKFKGKDRAVIPYLVWPESTAGTVTQYGRS